MSASVRGVNDLGYFRGDGTGSYFDIVQAECTPLSLEPRSGFLGALYVCGGQGVVGAWRIVTTTGIGNTVDTPLANELLFQQCTAANTSNDNVGTYVTRSAMTYLSS